ncbi:MULTISPECIES: type III secretion system inner rod subunit SctI [Enterobacterales]|uniref:type III secretion system inner rod subunit SctI n=1 Tax=Enterobacterales TaxID=91347 RepID=UPI000847EB77|nr:MULTISPECIES: type III secretion system inner rod subunit SctI [Enterobacterales]WOO49395.1 type III secretion system inner rod subunit SctI [Hafnia alvei]MCT6516849.1 type III secretion system inner rod subunit SctI [Proteus vulgaris]ODQ08118.1 type III secretion protein [Shigella sp. FC130]OEI93213.1 type III secretion protein [Shigella sp. FC1655]OEJ08968.1 type III secretion protein [Shigella sp. FC1967]
MSITPVIPVHLSTQSNANSDSDDNLSSIMINTVTSGFQYEKQIQKKLATLNKLSDVQSYTELQTTLNDYTITMNLASTLARKSLNIVETLLKAQ